MCSSDLADDKTFPAWNLPLLSAHHQPAAATATIRPVMQQVKIFKGLESNLPGLEKEVNAWLAESNARVLQMFGNLAATSGERNETNSLSAYPYVASDVLLVVLYEMPEPSVQPG